MCLISLLFPVFNYCLLVNTINESVLKFHFIAIACPSHLLRNEAGSMPWPDNICDTSDQHRFLWRMQQWYVLHSTHNKKSNTKYKSSLKSWKSQMTMYTEKEHLEWRFVAVACEQVHYFKWQSTSYCLHNSLCCEENLLTRKHFI